jgi:hypothetical protein
MFLCIRRRRRREERRAVADGLRLLADSITATEEAKRAGLERLLQEFEGQRGADPEQRDTEV